MTSPHLFELGSKLMGVYFVGMALVNLPWVMFASWPFNPLTLGPGQDRVFMALFALAIFSMCVFGWLLLRRSDLMRRIAFPQSEESQSSELEEFFSVGVKLFGAFLAVRELSGFARVFSNFIFIATSQDSSASNTAEAIGMPFNILPSLVTILFGVLFFLRGELLSKWAFAERVVGEDPD